jgi:hypothetical protein
MELARQVLHGHFESAYLLQVSKNDDKKRCFLKYLALVTDKLLL